MTAASSATLDSRQLPRAGRGSWSAARGIGPAVFGLVSFFVGWEVLVRVTNTPSFVVPAPSAIVPRLWIELPTYSVEFLYTLAAAGIGLAIGTTVGVIGAVLMANWRILERSLFPLAVILKLVPFIAIAPLLRIWLGYELLPKIVLAALITFFPVLVNCITGMRSVDATTLEFFHSVHASKRDIFWHLRVPNTLPYFFAALRLNVSLSLIGAIVGELVGARDGLGHMIAEAAITLRTTDVFSGVIVLTVMGIVLTELVSFIQSRVLYWHETERA